MDTYYRTPLRSSVRNIFRSRIVHVTLLVLLAALIFRAGLQLAPISGVQRLPGANALDAPLLIPPVTLITPLGDVSDVVRWYRANETEVRDIFHDDARAAALFAMYTVHTAKAYGEAPTPSTLAEFIQADRAHCGTYTVAQQAITEALGYRTRVVSFDSGVHGWIEVEIAGRWEIFDSTVNVWIDQPGEALLTGGTRSYRTFYYPALDPAMPDIYRAHLGEGYDAIGLRGQMPFLGMAGIGSDWGQLSMR